MILGRAGALVLADHPSALHVRLTGPLDARIEQAIALGETDRRDGGASAEQTDRAREALRPPLLPRRRARRRRTITSCSTRRRCRCPPAPPSSWRRRRHGSSPAVSGPEPQQRPASPLRTSTRTFAALRQPALGAERHAEGAAALRLACRFEPARRTDALSLRDSPAFGVTLQRTAVRFLMSLQVDLHPRRGAGSPLGRPGPAGRRGRWGRPGRRDPAGRQRRPSRVTLRAAGPVGPADPAGPSGRRDGRAGRPAALRARLERPLCRSATSSASARRVGVEPGLPDGVRLAARRGEADEHLARVLRRDRRFVHVSSPTMKSPAES